MSLEFDIACLRAPHDVNSFLDMTQLVSRASMAADQLEEQADRIATLEAELKDLKTTQEIVVAHACDNETRLLARVDKAEAEVEKAKQLNTEWGYRYSELESEVARLREILEKVAQGSQLCRDFPGWSISEELCDLIRNALATRQEEEKHVEP